VYDLNAVENQDQKDIYTIIMKYLYYKLCRDFVGKESNNKSGIFSLMWLSVIHSVNIIAILLVVNYFYKLKIFYYNNKSDATILATIFFVSCMILDYLLFYRKREKITEKYQNESKLMKVLGIIFLYAYMIGSFVLVYILSRAFPIR